MKIEDSLPLFAPYQYHNVIVLPIKERLQALVKKSPQRLTEYEYAYEFISDQIVNKNNYEAYQGELSKFLNWCWFYNLDIRDVKRSDMTKFIKFGNTPPEDLINDKVTQMLIEESGELSVNSEWRPFKKKRGSTYERKEASVRRQLSVLSMFYTFLADEGYCLVNPPAIALRRLNIKQMDNVDSTENDNKCLSQTQLSYVLFIVDRLCEINPARFERSRFLFYLMIMAFPRRSEVSATMTYSPLMSDFERHKLSGGDRYTFNIRLAKGGKSRKVLCSKELMSALSRYRLFLGLSALPSLADDEKPLFVRHRPASHGREAGKVDANLSAKSIAELIKELYEFAAIQLEKDGLIDEAIAIRELSAHSTRHTGITLALTAGRSPEKLMKDTGHSSINSLMIYNNNSLEYRLEDVDKLDSKVIELARLVA